MKKAHYGTWIWILGCAAAVTFAAPTHLHAAASEITALKELSQGFSGVAKKAIPAVVSIRVKIEPKKGNGSLIPWGFQDDESGDQSDMFWGQFFNFRGGVPKAQPQMGQASGFIVSPDGYLLTNSHVVQDASEISVILNDGREFPGKVVGQDPSTDIAVVKIDGANLPTLALGNSDQLEPGQWVIAIGSPLELKSTLTVGVVSATGRNDLSIARVEDFIQTDAAINRGNSGGPLLNLDGEVVGINTAIAAGGYSGIGFAVPSNIAKNDLEQIMSKGSVSRGFLGVTLQRIDKNLATAFGLESHEGALVADVAMDTPAQKAGIKRGDVIVKINNNTVINMAALRNSIALMVPGSKATLGILRDGKPIEINVEIGDFPSATTAQADAVEDKHLGITVDNFTREMAHSLGLGDLQGVVIKKVDAGSVAAWAGLKKGAIILEVNKQKIANVEQFNAAFKGMAKDKPVLLLVKQGELVQYLSIQAG
jgi:serine protease Do